MDIASVRIPDMTLNIRITKPRGLRIRMALMIAALWIANKVAPPNIEVRIETTFSD